MQKYKSNITTTSGAAVRGVPVLVIDEDGNNAALFLDRAGTVQAANPLSTASDGTFYFYAENGRYSLRTTVDGVTITDADVALLWDPAEVLLSGPLAEAVERAEASAAQAEAAVADSGIVDLVASAQNAVVDAQLALAEASGLGQAAQEAEDAAASAVLASQVATDAANLAVDAAQDAILASAATIKAYATHAEAAIAAALLPDGADVEISQDETRANARTRYKVQAGVLVFVVNLDQTKLDLAAATGASLVGFQQAGTGAVPTTVQSKLRESVSVKDFGAVGGGVVDDTAAIIVALTAAVARCNAGQPTTLFFPADIYKVTAALGTYSCSNLTIDLNGSTIDASTASFSGALLRFSGSIGAYTTLTGSGVEGNYFVLAPSTGFVRGDWVKIISESVWDASNTNTRYGELNKVPESDTAAVALPAGRIYVSAPLATNYSSIQAARIARVEMLTDICVINGKLVGPSVFRDTSAGLRFDYVNGLKVSNVTFSDFDDRCIYIKDSASSVVTACQFHHTRPIALGYGVSFVDAAQDSFVSMCTFEDVRHALSTNNNTSTDYGITRRITFDTNTVLYSARASVTSSTFTADAAANTITMATPSATFSNGRLIRAVTTGTLPGGLGAEFNYYLGAVVPSTTFSLHLTVDDALALTNPVDITSVGTGTNTATAYTGGDAVDTHSGADYIKITNNNVVGSSASGINVECPNAEILGNTVIGSEAYGIYFHSEADRVGSVLISNNRVERTGGCGLLVSQGTRGTASEMRRVVIAGNSVWQAGQQAGMYAFSEGIRVNDATTVTQDGFVISGNSIQNGANGGLYAEKLNGASIIGNSLFNNAGIGIRVQESSKVAISGNNVLVPSTVSVDGIAVTGASSNMAIVGNVVSSAAGTVTGSGISLANTVTTCTVNDNAVSAFTIRRTLGTGSGNSGLTAIGSATYDPASLADGVGVTTTVAATGASLGDVAQASFTQPLQGITLNAWVSAADVVSVRFQNESGGVLDLASGTLRVIAERIG